jgi:hypothetical protein
MTLAIQEEYVNATEGYFLSEPVVTEDPFTEDIGEIFKFAQKEHGRCISSIYIDEEGGRKRVGWVFQKRVQYEDSEDSFLLETWVTLLSKPPEVRRHVDYKEIG